MLHFIFLLSIALVILTLIENRRVAIALTGIWLFLFASLRFNAGFDYLSYVREITAGDGRLVRYEPVSRAIMEFAARTHPQWFFVITSAVAIGCMTLAILNAEKRAGISRLGILAFLTFPIGFFDSLNFVRQMCSIALLIYALTSRDRPARMIIAAILSVGFHFSAMIWIPIMLLTAYFRLAVPKVAYIAALCIAATSGPLIEYMSKIFGLYSHYFIKYNIDSGGRALILLVAILTFSLLELKKIRRVGLIPEFNFFFVGVCVYLALAPYGTHIARFGWYGAAMYPIFMGLLLSRTDLAMKAATVGVMVTIFSGLLYLSSQHPRWDGLNNYRISLLVDQTEAISTYEAFERANSAR